MFSNRLSVSKFVFKRRLLRAYDILWAKAPRDLVGSLRFICKNARVKGNPFKRIPFDFFKTSSINSVVTKYSEYSDSIFNCIDFCVRKVLCVIYPQDGNNLYKWYRAKLQEDQMIVDGMIGILRGVKKGSVEKRVIQACLFANLPAPRVKELLERHGNVFDDMKQDALDGGQSSSTSVGASVGSTSDGSGHLGSGSTENERSQSVDDEGGERSQSGEAHSDDGDALDERELRAVGIDDEIDISVPSGGYLSDDSDDDEDGSQNVNVSEVGVNRRKHSSGMLCRTRKRAREDWTSMQNDGMVKRTKTIRVRFEEDTIDKCVKFILCSENVNLLSWGMTRIKFNGEVHPFPSIVRKKSAMEIYRRYKMDDVNFTKNERKIGRTVFMNIVSRLTRGSVKQVVCVDYFLNGLITENFANLQKIVRIEVAEKKKRESLQKELAAAEQFLKYTYRAHIGDEEDDPIHDCRFALRKRRKTDKKEASWCEDCNAPFVIVEKIFKACGKGNEHIRLVLDDAKKKMELFMGHKIRERRQEEQIRGLFSKLRDREGGTAAVVYLDYKMKVVPLRFRETQPQYFGKSGMVLHGAAVYYRPSCEEDQIVANKNLLKNSRKGKTDDDLSMFFVDHVVENEKKEDRITTLSIVEALLMRMRVMLPDCEDIYLVTDKARAYRNDLSPVMLAFIMREHKFKLRVYVNPDAQCGKTGVDGHHGVTTRHIKRYVLETGNDVTTPIHLAKAMMYDGGVKNTAVDLLTIDRAAENHLKYSSAHAAGFICKLGNVSEIEYDDDDDENGSVPVKVYEHSRCEAKEFIFEPNHSRRKGTKVAQRRKERYEAILLKTKEDIEIAKERKSNMKRYRHEKFVQSIISCIFEASCGGAVNHVSKEGLSDDEDEDEDQLADEDFDAECAVEDGDGTQVDLEGEEGEQCNQGESAIDAGHISTTDAPRLADNGIVDGVCGDQVCKEQGENSDEDDGEFDERVLLRKPVWVGKYTGVSVRYTGPMHFWDRQTYVSSKNAILDASIEVEIQEEEDEQRRRELSDTKDQAAKKYCDGVVPGHNEHVSEGDSRGDIGDAHGGRPESNVEAQIGSNVDDNGGRQDGDGKNRLESLKVSKSHAERYACRDGKIYNCAVCGKVYRRKKMMEAHEKTCNNVKSDRTTVNVAMEIANRIVYVQGDIDVKTMIDKNDNLPEVKFDTENRSRRFLPGWARTAEWGGSMGRNTIKRYSDHVDEWFDEGAVNPGKKMASSRMLEMLQLRYPYRYDLPSEKQIQTYVSGLVTEEKKRKVEHAKHRIWNSVKENSTAVKVGGKRPRESGRNLQHTEGGSTVDHAEPRVDAGDHSEVASDKGNAGGPGEESVPNNQEPSGALLRGGVEVCNGRGRGDSVSPASGSQAGREEKDVSEIRCVTTVGQSAKPIPSKRHSKKRGAGEGHRKTPKTPRTVMKKEYSEPLQQLVEAERNLKRTDARARLISILNLDPENLPDDFPGEKQVIGKVSNIKQNLKK